MVRYTLLFSLPRLSLNEVSPFVFQQRRQTPPVTHLMIDKTLPVSISSSVPSGWAKHAIGLQFATANATVIFSAINIMHAGTMANGNGGCDLGDKEGRKDTNMLYCEAQCVVPLWAAGTLMGASYGSLCGYGRMASKVLAAAHSVVTSPATELDSTTPCLLAYLRQNLLRKQRILVLGNNTTWDPQTLVNDMIHFGVGNWHDASMQDMFVLKDFISEIL